MAFFDIFKKKQDTPPTGEQAQKQQEELSAGLEKTKTGLFSKLARAVAGRSTIDAGVLDDLEEVLISSDVGVETTVKIIRRIEERVARDKYMNASELQSILRGEIATLMEDAHGSSENFGLDATEGQPYVVMVVGVNGAGKTTTVGKIASEAKDAGRRPIIGSADTFRAAAIEQLEVWGERAGMPVHVVLVIDSTTGQNGLSQAREFNNALGIDGVVMTKLDGTAKGGIALAVSHDLGLPILRVGVGETIDDLKPFDAREFSRALITGEEE